MVSGPVPAWLESLSRAGRWFRYTIRSLIGVLAVALVISMFPAADVASADPTDPRQRELHLRPTRPSNADPGRRRAAPRPRQGADQRATSASGLKLLGRRLLNPVSGSFTSRDPVFGGNTSDYSYPQNPIDESDLNGMYKLGRHEKRACARYALGCFAARNAFKQAYAERDRRYSRSPKGRRKLEANAFVHAYWSALMVYQSYWRVPQYYLSKSMRFAKAMGDPHEEDYPGKDTSKDLYNNGVGRQIASRAIRGRLSTGWIADMLYWKTSRYCRFDCLQVRVY